MKCNKGSHIGYSVVDQQDNYPPRTMGHYICIKTIMFHTVGHELFKLIDNITSAIPGHVKDLLPWTNRPLRFFSSTGHITWYSCVGTSTGTRKIYAKWVWDRYLKRPRSDSLFLFHLSIFNLSLFLLNLQSKNIALVLWLP